MFGIPDGNKGKWVFCKEWIGLAILILPTLVVAGAPPQKAGAAAGISETSTAFGGSLGVAILGSIWTAIYRRDMGRAIAGSPSPAMAVVVMKIFDRKKATG